MSCAYRDCWFKTIIKHMIFSSTQSDIGVNKQALILVSQEKKID